MMVLDGVGDHARKKLHDEEHGSNDIGAEHVAYLRPGVLQKGLPGCQGSIVDDQSGQTNLDRCFIKHFMSNQVRTIFGSKYLVLEEVFLLILAENWFLSTNYLNLG